MPAIRETQKITQEVGITQFSNFTAVFKPINEKSAEAKTPNEIEDKI